MERGRREREGLRGKEGREWDREREKRDEKERCRGR